MGNTLSEVDTILLINLASPSSSAEVLSTWWKSFWGIKVPRKILIFGCGDSNAHAVFWCVFSQEVWELLEFSFLIGHKEEITFNGVLLYASELLEKEEFAKMLIAAWSIWTERNKITHGQQRRTPQQIKTWSSSYYEEVSNAHTQEDRVVSEEESSHRGQAGQAEVQIHDHTLFVDAAVSTSSKKVGLGAVILASDKKVQAALSKPLEGTLSVFHAEALALLVGLRWAQNIGLPILMILSDSLSLVQDFIFQSLATIDHVSRKFNVTAHNLTKHALQLENESSWMEEIPHAENHN
ncbi:hypothetical protein POM88_049733 [Heracleum sosnowskyi]|uniref:RNase H type-1 domain-containing protein n=1 Tax=Heracleum sosnowskyi TaxID=360622 RepID=A0AAD8M1U5_9APIA|nr:hypothetical protein POM88_049733 [Heracleum sosnowskyi]